MSYDISLREPTTGDVVQFDAPHHMKGGTYAIGGTTEAWLNITFNYALVLQKWSVPGGRRGS